MASTSTGRFWNEYEEYHDLAMAFDHNVERTHPESVTSRGMCPCLDFTRWCGWAATAVKYYEYRGPDVKNL